VALSLACGLVGEAEVALGWPAVFLTVTVSPIFIGTRGVRI
jgi:hypothetical protein